MADSTRPGMTRSSSFLDSLYDSGSLELVWENGQVHVQGGSSSGVTPKTASWGGYSIKPSDECAKNARLSALYSLMDFPVQRHSDLNNSQQNSHQSNNQNSSQLDFEFSKSKSSDMHKVGCANLRQKPLISDASNPVFFVPRSEEAPSDDQSEAVGHNSALNIQGNHAQYHNQTSSSAELGGKEKTDTNCFDQALLESSSLCSLGASNNDKRKHVDIDDPTYLSDNDEEEPEDAVKEKPAHRVKGSRNAETHNLCERKRRDKINKRMRALKELIPNCNKMDKASILDDAIEYLKSLKLQLQIMSTGAGFCMPFMMLPSATHHMINTHHLHQLMGAGMGFRPGSLPQFPITSLLGITDNRAGMFGFPNQMQPMPISHAPFIPMVANPSTQPFLATTNVPENSTSSQLTTLKASAPNNSYLWGHSEYATNQAPNQVSLDH